MCGAAVVLIAVFLAQYAYVDAQIPIPCAEPESLTARECCPIPAKFSDAGPCGSNLNPPRGSCRSINIPESEFNPTTGADVRVKWPIQYFNKICVCDEKYGGFDCGDCSFAYNDGMIDAEGRKTCLQETTRERKSLSVLDEGEWKEYLEALNKSKYALSRYVVFTDHFVNDIATLLSSKKNISQYDLFIWMHHFVAKDNDDGVDFAHEGLGFLTWHRLFLLWFEREMQVMLDDPDFRLYYWDWRETAQRENIFDPKRLGQNSADGTVTGFLFDESNWIPKCWYDKKNTNNDMNDTNNICDPDKEHENAHAIRRCPNDDSTPNICRSNNPLWPSYDDMDAALDINTYDASPFDEFVTGVDTGDRTGTSFRNYVEGFIPTVKPTSTEICDCSDYCAEKENNGVHYCVERTLHNSVHLILGGIRHDSELGTKPFTETGVMEDVAASPNDPVFVNHHTMIDCILEEWLQKNSDAKYPTTGGAEGHGADDYIVPLIPLYTHKDMLETADHFGYSCSLPKMTTPPDNTENPTNGGNNREGGASRSFHVHVSLVLGMLLAATYLQ